MQSQSSSSEDSDVEEDEELMMAASAWAQNKEEEEEEDGTNTSSDKHTGNIKGSGKSPSKEHGEFHSTAKHTISKDTITSPQPTSYSLHLTKVPYTATQTDIQFAFGQKGCNITSIRLVYDRDQKTGDRTFRGVAFVDVADEKSYKRGLEFHNKPFLGKGRKVMVRPTRTKSELSDIVRKTEEKVAMLIARSKENKKRERSDGGDDNDGSNSTMEKKGNDRHKKRRKNDKNKEKGKESDGSPATKSDTSSNAKQPNSNNNNAKDGKKKDKKKQKNKNKDKGKESDGSPASKSDTSSNAKQPNSINNAKDGKKKDKKTAIAPSAEGHGQKKSPKKNNDGAPVKLTKKERAKKAAIIRMKRLKGRK